MQFQLLGFGMPTKVEDLKVGDLFVMTRDDVALLALRAEDADSLFDVVLATTGPIANCPPPPFFVNPGVLSGGPYSRLNGEVVVRPTPHKAPLPAAQANLGNGQLVLDGHGLAFVYLRYEGGQGGGFFIDLATGKKGLPNAPRLSYRDWQIVRGHDPQTFEVLAGFPAS